MAKVVLNIGRSVESNGQRVHLHTVADVVSALEARVAELIAFQCKTSSTEPTVVAVVETADARTARKVVLDLCKVLQQDAIAYRVDGKGKMAGPRAAAWGPFNPAYFIEAAQ